jgi:hypothetical protein
MAFANQIEEVLKLIAETGDRCIVMSEDHGPYVIMDLNQYRTLLKSAAGKEKVANLTEAELLEKINQDIADWRESRAEDLSEYELSQFQIDMASAGGRSGRGAKQPVRPASNRPMARPDSNLPVVEDTHQGEYRLEPPV